MESYDSLRDRGFAALRSGDLAASRALLESALREAEAGCDAETVQAARCNLGMVLLQAGEIDRAEEGLRELLLSTRNPRIQRGASFNLALALKSRRQYERAEFYARKALDASRSDGDASAIASAYNLLGTLAMARSRLPRAERLFRLALAIRESRVRAEDDPDEYCRIVFLDNVGYCRVLRDDIEGGLPLLRRSLDLAERFGVRRYVAEAAQDLCFALLRRKELEEAAVFGARALEVAEADGHPDIRKNCFYLLGEIHSLLGQDGVADAFFDRLQALYPDLPFLRDFLRSFDISGMITLKEF